MHRRSGDRLREGKILPIVTFNVPRHPGCNRGGREIAIGDDA